LTTAAVGVVALALYAKAVPCAFAHIFHLPCPGCGSTRAVLAFFQGDLHGVLRYNPFGPVVAMLIGLFAVLSFASVLVHGDFRGVGEGRFGRLLKRAFVVVAVLEVALWIARFAGAFGGAVPV
jgi:Protein of unknown function (DUF2752)